MSDATRHTISIDGTGRVTVAIAFYPTGAAGGGGGGGGASLTTGSMISGLWTTAPTGFVLMQGNTIGSLASGATRADADTEDLFALLWTNLSNTLAPVSGGRGGSAAADFAANKTLTIPDMRTRAPIGAKADEVLDGVNAILGQPLGSKDHQLVESELPIVAGHTHTVLTGNHTHDVPILSGSISATPGTTSAQGVNNASDAQLATGNNTALGLSTDSSGGFGSDFAHNITQLSLCVNFAIKL